MPPIARLLEGALLREGPEPEDGEGADEAEPTFEPVAIDVNTNINRGHC